jgi:hypothetical protein
MKVKQKTKRCILKGVEQELNPEPTPGSGSRLRLYTGLFYLSGN